MLITIAIVFRNEKTNLPGLLDSLADVITDEMKGSFQFLFIDNDSSDDSSQLLRDWICASKFKNSKIIKRSRNNMGEARQQALIETLSPWLVFLDADARVQAHWAEGVLAATGQLDSTVVCVGGMEKSYGHKSWHHYAKGLSDYFPLGKSVHEKRRVKHVPTNNCLIHCRRALGAGGFRSFFSYVGEDLDFTARVSRVGKIIFDPSFCIQHQLPLKLSSWCMKMFRYGNAQTFVLLENCGVIPVFKFLPAALVVGLVFLLHFFPMTVALFLVVILITPRLGFFAVTFLLYGGGELFGVPQYIYLKLKAQVSRFFGFSAEDEN